tara:strand:+ start:5220 stop:5474 length:255 start_codon:yes stop_codon:yes gene_type:complete
MEVLGMELMDLLIGAIYLAAAVLGWFLKDALYDIKTTKENLASFKTEIAKEYVPRNDMRELSQEVGRRFDRLEEKLDRLVERGN